MSLLALPAVGLRECMHQPRDILEIDCFDLKGRYVHPITPFQSEVQHLGRLARGRLTLGKFCDNEPIFFYGGRRFSQSVYERMLSIVLRAPMRFFDTTFTGVLLNRFGSDIAVLDVELPEIIRLLGVSDLSAFASRQQIVWEIPQSHSRRLAAQSVPIPILRCGARESNGPVANMLTYRVSSRL